MRMTMPKTVIAAGLSAAVLMLALVPGRAAAAEDAYVNVVELDIKPAEIAKFLEAIRENGAAAVKEPGCREFNITVAKTDPNHVLLFEVYDSEAALNAHRATDHFKKYQATTKDMIAGRNVRAMTGLAFNAKAQ